MKRLHPLTDSESQSVTRHGREELLMTSSRLTAVEYDAGSRKSRTTLSGELTFFPLLRPRCTSLQWQTQRSIRESAADGTAFILVPTTRHLHPALIAYSPSPLMNLMMESISFSETDSFSRWPLPEAKKRITLSIGVCDFIIDVLLILLASDCMPAIAWGYALMNTRCDNRHQIYAKFL